MARWEWRTLPDDSVEVDRRDGGGFQALPSHEHANVVRTADRTLEWTELAQKYATKYDIPVSWILGVIFAESGGDPKAENFCCAGLMAIFWSVHGKTKQDMLDPDKNVDYGASLLAATKAKGYQLPGVASVHVAGGGMTGTPHTSFKSPWGMAEHMWLDNPQGDGSVGYIDRVVRANNMMVHRLAAHPPHIEPPVGPLPVLPAVSRASFGSQLLPFVAGAGAGFLAIMLLPRLR